MKATLHTLAHLLGRAVKVLLRHQVRPWRGLLGFLLFLPECL